MKLFASGILLVLIGLVSDLRLDIQKETAIKATLSTQLRQLIHAVDEYQSSTTTAKRILSKEFDDIRIQYKQLEFIFLPVAKTEQLEQINNNKFWVNYSQQKREVFPETGAFQLIEQALLAADTADVNHIIQQEANRISATLKALLLQIENKTYARGEIFYLLRHNLFYHYLTTLNAYDRIDTQKSILEFRSAIKFQVELLRLLPPQQRDSKDTKEAILLLKQLDAHIKFQLWESIDRALVYERWVSAIAKLYTHEASALGYIPKSSDPTSLQDYHLFSEAFFNLPYFTDIPTTESASPLVALGKQLFYDPILSANNKRTCASCHKASKAFTDGRQTSMGFDLIAKGKRNASSLINSIYKQQFQHDLSKDNLFDQITFVVNHPLEFNTSWQAITQKIATSEQYLAQFQSCFQQASVDSTQIVMALTAYTATLNSMNSPFDQYMSRASDHIDFGVLEGYNIFMGKAQCGNCHFPPLFSGLKPNKYDEQNYFKIDAPNIRDGEVGMAGRVSFDERYLHFFNVPTVRNLAYTNPYFHNGSLFSVEACIDAHQTEALPHLKDLSAEDLAKITQFIEALNDPTLTQLDENVVLPKTDGSLAPIERRSAGVY
ncbi:MAG: cytochrome-c peroxidase [Bacteroidota bacterium]